MKTLITILAMFNYLSACALATTSSLKKELAMTSDNQAVAASFFQHVTAGEIDTAFALVGDNVSWWVPGDLPFSGFKTKKEYMGIINQIRKAFPTGFELKVLSMIAEGDRVAAEVVSNGLHVNGKKYNNKYHFLLRFEAGKMIEVKEYMDTLHLYRLITPS